MGCGYFVLMEFAVDFSRVLLHIFYTDLYIDRLMSRKVIMVENNLCSLFKQPLTYMTYNL